MPDNGLRISSQIMIPVKEIEVSAIRAQGAGGQNVNKVASAVHIRFDIRGSSLSDFCKHRLLCVVDHHITKEGVIVIKAQQHRSQEKNRDDGLNRLRRIILKAMAVQKKRKKTMPTQSSRVKRLDGKTRRGQIKNLRRNIREI
jgi:ribosome-associated protein